MGYTFTMLGALLQSKDPADRARAKAAIEKALVKHKGATDGAAKALGVTWGTLYAWMRKAGIATPKRTRKASAPKRTK